MGGGAGDEGPGVAGLRGEVVGVGAAAGLDEVRCVEMGRRAVERLDALVEGGAGGGPEVVVGTVRGAVVVVAEPACEGHGPVEDDGEQGACFEAVALLPGEEVRVAVDLGHADVDGAQVRWPAAREPGHVARELDVGVDAEEGLEVVRVEKLAVEAKGRAGPWERAVGVLVREERIEGVAHGEHVMCRDGDAGRGKEQIDRRDDAVSFGTISDDGGAVGDGKVGVPGAGGRLVVVYETVVVDHGRALAGVERRELQRVRAGVPDPVEQVA
ncbi:hypothetical protein VDGD_20683 [Verticillium dahliae]|nr:hypothetical protein VDGD_20683 [Verticillium dahliae]